MVKSVNRLALLQCACFHLKRLAIWTGREKEKHSKFWNLVLYTTILFDRWTFIFSWHVWFQVFSGFQMGSNVFCFFFIVLVSMGSQKQCSIEKIYLKLFILGGVVPTGLLTVDRDFFLVLGSSLNPCLHKKKKKKKLPKGVAVYRQQIMCTRKRFIWERMGPLVPFWMEKRNCIHGHISEPKQCENPMCHPPPHWHATHRTQPLANAKMLVNT